MGWLRAGVVGLTLVSSSGCAASVSSFQPAHVAKPGEVSAEAGIDLSFSVGTITDIVDAAEAADDVTSERQLTDAEQRAILDGAAGLGLNPPALIAHVGAAYVPWEAWEFGLRLSTSGWRLGSRRQLLEQDKAGIDLSLGIGFGSAFFTPPIEEVLETLVVEDYSRWNVDVPIAIGRHASWYRWWLGPRLFYSTTSQSMTVELRDGELVHGSVSGDAIYLGGFAGAALGYDRVFVGPEVAVVRMLGEADVTISDTTTGVDLDGWVLHPGFAVMGEF